MLLRQRRGAPSSQYRRYDRKSPQISLQMQVDTPVLAALLFDLANAHAPDFFGVGHMGPAAGL
jgi:hypothetical protein